MIQIPKDLEDTKFTFDITMPWIRDENLTQRAAVRVRSNITDVDANVTFDKEWKIHAQSRLV